MNRVYTVENAMLGINRDICVTISCRSDRSHCRIDTAVLEDCDGIFEPVQARQFWINRTWECTRFDSVMSSVFYKWLENESGLTDFFRARGFEKKSYKSPTAETRRLEKVAALENVRSLHYDLMRLFREGKGSISDLRKSGTATATACNGGKHNAA